MSESGRHDSDPTFVVSDSSNITVGEVSSTNLLDMVDANILYRSWSSLMQV